MTGPDAEQEPVPGLSFSETYTAVDPRLLERSPALQLALSGALTIPEAAAATGASERTLRRKLAAGALPGAEMAGGRWLIPEAALIAAGYTLAEPTPEADRAEPTAPAPEAAPAGWLLERAELEKRAELAEQRAEAADALAHERLVRLERAESNLARALTALPAPAPAEPETVIVESAPQRRRWWQRSE